MVFILMLFILMRALSVTLERKVPYFLIQSVYRLSFLCDCDKYDILPVQANRVRIISTATDWFQLQHLNDDCEGARSHWCNTLEKRLLVL